MSTFVVVAIGLTVVILFYPYGNGHVEDSPIRDTGTSLYTKTELTTH